MNVKGLRVIPGGQAEVPAGPSGLLQELYEKHASVTDDEARKVDT